MKTKKIPKHELAIITKILVKNSEIITFLSYLKISMLTSQEVRAAFLAAKSIFMSKQKIDRSSLSATISGNHKLLKIFSDENGLADFLDAAYNTEAGASTMMYIESVKKQHVRDISRKMAEEIVGQSDELSPEDLLIKWTQCRENILTCSETEETPYLIDILPNILEGKAETIKGLRSGFPKFDAQTNGFIRKEFYVFAGDTGVGKSSLMTQIAWSLMLDGAKVLHINTEMSEELIAIRTISQLARVPFREVLNKTFQNTVQYVQSIEKARRHLEELKDQYIFYYLPFWTPAKIMSLIQRHCFQDGIDVVIFDNIKKEVKDNADPYLDLHALTSYLKGSAGEFDIPVIAAAQTQRMADCARVEKGNMADSHDITRHATAVYGLSKKTKAKMLENSRKGNMILTVPKARLSEDGDAILFDLDYNKENLRYTEK